MSNPSVQAYNYIVNLERIERRDVIVKKFCIDYRWERWFLYLYGKPIYAVVKDTVMNRARGLLQSGMKCKDVAVATGYKDIHSFLSSYKKHFGHAPSYDKPKT
jgi:transcriptional regulator GlxA family with amidase domain